MDIVKLYHYCGDIASKSPIEVRNNRYYCTRCKVSYKYTNALRRQVFHWHGPPYADPLILILPIPEPPVERLYKREAAKQLRSLQSVYADS